MGAMPRDAVMRAPVPFTGGPMRAAEAQGIAPSVVDANTQVGALERLVTENAALRRQIAERDARIIMLGAALQRRTQEAEQHAAVSPVLEAVGRAHDISVAVLTGNRRMRHVTHARQMAVALVVELRDDMTLTAVAHACGVCDHTGINYAVGCVHDRVRAGTIGPHWALLRAELGLPAALPGRVGGFIWTARGEKGC